MHLPNILITGSRGLLGHALQSTKPDFVTLVNFSSFDCDLRNYQQTYLAIEQQHKKNPIDAIIHCAARVGGLYRNLREPVQMMDENLSMNSNVLKAAHHLGIQKVICVLSTCIFPDGLYENEKDEKSLHYELKPEDLHRGPPHFSNECYAYAKRMCEVLCRAYQRQYRREYFCVVPTNIYGKYDNFDLQNSHVVPALIRKCHSAAHDPNHDNIFRVLGDGYVHRQFIYSEDCANIIWWALTHYTHYDIPLMCVPTDSEVLLRDVITTIADVVEFEGEIEYDTDAHKGQENKKSLDTNTQLIQLGYNKVFYWTNLHDGLKFTYKWYKQYLEMDNNE